MFRANLQWKQLQNAYKQQYDEMKTILWYDTHKQSMMSHSSVVNFQDCEYQNCQYKYVITDKDVKLKEPFDAVAVLVQAKALLPFHLHQGKIETKFLFLLGKMRFQQPGLFSDRRLDNFGLAYLIGR